MIYVSNDIINPRFQIEMTLRHITMTQMHFFIAYLYNKAQKVAFILLTEK